MRKPLKDILPYIVITSSILFLLKTTWMRWGDIIIDIGREMYIPLEVSRGKILYTDIHYIYGPFPIYLHAILYKLFGAHINILIICGIATTFLTAILLYKISRFFINAVYSSLVSLGFIFTCAFGNYVYLNNYNFILPYSYAATYGILFGLIAIYFFIKFIYPAPSCEVEYLAGRCGIYNNRSKNLLVYSLFNTFVLLCKIEIGISLLITVITILFIHKRRLGLILLSLAPIVMATVVYGLFFIKTGALAALNKNFLIALSPNNKLFLNWLLGITELRTNIYLILYPLLLYIFALLCFLPFDYILNNLRDNIFIRFFITFTLYLLAFITIILINNSVNPHIQYRVLPVICLITILFAVKKEHPAILTVSLFSFLLTARIILRVSAAHYGFYILVPGFITYYLFFYNIIPQIFQKFTKNGLYYLSMSILFILLVLNHFKIYIPVYNARTLRIETNRGTINYLNNIIGIRYKELAEYLINNTSTNETLVVFPEGIDINFFTGLDNPIFYNTFLPFELAEKEKQTEIINQIALAKVDYIVIIQRDTTEYGPPSFGIDYGIELFSWIKENYEIIKTFGPMPFTTDEFGITLMKNLTNPPSQGQTRKPEYPPG